MIYLVRHRTTYSYESEVTFARCALRLTPRSSGSQTVLETRLTVTPEPTSASTRTGPFAEATDTVVIETPHCKLVIEAVSRVEVNTPLAELDFGAPWEQVRNRALEAADLGPEGPASYLYPTPRTPLSAGITD